MWHISGRLVSTKRGLGGDAAAGAETDAPQPLRGNRRSAEASHRSRAGRGSLYMCSSEVS